MAELSVGLLLYPQFEVLDMAGPIEILNVLAVYMGHHLKLSVISTTMDPVTPGPVIPNSSTPFASQQLYLPTHTMDNAPALDMLIVPGGGAVTDRESLQPHVDFIRQLHKGSDGKPPVKYFFSVCTGAMLFGWAGILDGQRATTNKAYWEFAVGSSKKTQWIAKARWVASGDIWTSSGVTAGIDGMLALVATIFGEEEADKACATIEHIRAKSSDDDPWAEPNGCKDVAPVQG